MPDDLLVDGGRGSAQQLCGQLRRIDVGRDQSPTADPVLGRKRGVDRARAALKTTVTLVGVAGAGGVLSFPARRPFRGEFRRHVQIELPVRHRQCQPLELKLPHPGHNVAVSTLVGLACLRLKGPYVALLTLAVAQVLYLLIVNDTECFTNPPSGCMPPIRVTNAFSSRFRDNDRARIDAARRHSQCIRCAGAPSAVRGCSAPCSASVRSS